jgi:methionyl-tRNA formyltransferase
LIGEPDFHVEAVVTQPDRPSGRGLLTEPSPVKQVAAAAGLLLFQPSKVRTEEAYEFFRRIAPDAVVIIAFGQIIPQRLIEIPRFGWINLHASLLPKYRGAAPMQWAVAEGELRTGLTTIQIDAGLDTGPILAQWTTEIGLDETAPELADRMAPAGADLVVETLRGMGAGRIVPRPQQSSQASLAPMLKKEDGHIDWAWPATKIYNRIRGLAPWPGAYTSFRQKLCHVWGRPVDPQYAYGTAQPGALRAADGALYVSCGEATWLRIDALQLEGRRKIHTRDFLSGARLLPGERFGS